MTALRPFCMPKWGIEMTEGTITEWMVADGQPVRKGDILCLIETAKISNEVEAERDGVVLKIVAPAGDAALPVGALLAVIGDDAADAGAVAAFIAGYVPEAGGIGARDDDAAPVAATAPALIETNRAISPKALALASAEGVDLERVQGTGRGGRITHQDVVRALQPAIVPVWRGPVQQPDDDRKVFASPLARRLAAQNGIDLATIAGTGARGRIARRDVLAVIAAARPAPAASAAFVPGANPATIEPFDKIRRVVAQRLTRAKQDIPHFYLRISVDVDALLTLRRHANLVLQQQSSVNDWLVWACGRALAQHPAVNTRIEGETLHRYAHADIAVAVDSPRGLVTPVIRQVDRMGIADVAAASKALVAKAREGKLGYDDLDGGTFTVSNLGMFGIDQFDAIINPPQAAILAVGAARREPVETADGDIAFATRIALTLSVDHRAVDGAAGAKFLATLKGLIEAPESLFG